MKTIFRTILLTLGLCLALPAVAITGARSTAPLYTKHNIGVRMDADAANFCQRANITNDLLTIGAIDQFVTSLKSNNLWTNFAGIYPMVGASSNSTAQNLRSTNYNITWGTNIAFYNIGVSNKGGITGGGDTGYSFTNFPNPSQVGFHLYAWFATNGVTLNNSVFGANDGTASVLLSAHGDLNTDCGAGETAGTATTFAGGHLFAEQCSSFSGVMTSFGGYVLTQAFAESPCSNPNPDANVKLLSAEGGITHATFRFATFGGGMSTSQVQKFFTIVDRFQQALGRQNP